MLHAASPHPDRDPERERDHALTRRAGRLPQALTQALGPRTYAHTHGDEGGKKEGGGYERQKVHWCQQVSTGGAEKREKIAKVIHTINKRGENRQREPREKESKKKKEKAKGRRGRLFERKRVSVVGSA